MPRSHARILVTIWADPEWRALPRDCQWFYELVLSQPGIAHCGVVQIPRSGWVNCSADDDNSVAIAAAMKILDDRRFLVVDDETDEILVRSFMRHDGVLAGPPGTLKNALVTARAVVSPRIRAALLVELSQVDEAEIAMKKVRQGHEHPAVTLRATLKALGSGSPPPVDVARKPMADATADGTTYGMANAIADTSDGGHSDALFGVETDAIGDAIGDAMSNASGVGEGVGVRSSTHVGTNSALEKKISRTSRSKREPNLTGFEDFWAAYPSKVAKIKSQASYAKALESGVEPAELLSAAHRYARWIVAAGKQDYVAHPTTWLNQGRWDDELLEPPTEMRPPRNGTRTRDDKRAAIGSVVTEVFGTSALQPDLRALPGGRP